MKLTWNFLIRFTKHRYPKIKSIIKKFVQCIEKSSWCLIVLPKITVIIKCNFECHDKIKLYVLIIGIWTNQRCGHKISSGFFSPDNSKVVRSNEVFTCNGKYNTEHFGCILLAWLFAGRWSGIIFKCFWIPFKNESQLNCELKMFKSLTKLDNEIYIQ